MGNSPSTSKPASQSSSSQSHSQHDRPVRRENKNPIPVQGLGVAAPPEPSLTQAQGAVQPPSSSNSSVASRPKPLQPLAIGTPTASSSTTAASSASSAKPVEVKQATCADPCHAPAKPVAVPSSNNAPSSPPRSPRSEDGDEPAAAMPHSSMQDVSYLTRPPRLPLPIEEEVHTPGSPIIAPTDVTEPIGDVESLSSAALGHPTSSLSDTSALEEDDAEELLVDKTRPTVPTRLEWRHGGDKVYVTGTIFQWNRKTRLHPVEGQPGVFAATINILPGTHHIRFLVDGQMQTAPDYPTTVDFGNNLVNYIEVSPDDVQPSTAAEDAAARDKTAQAEEAAAGQEEGLAPASRLRKVPPAEQFQQKIPKYLLDLDQPEDSPQYQQAVLATEKLPSPPGLPGFLSKPILNAATQRKDDNSVLTQPNHTVLNHLATSSIKNNVLAVSATTRYKSKYVTTIMYKPTSTE
ncbi:hypothetical protein VTH06DRAFT_6618 [Thermothelomyces fergusii]